MGRMDPTTAQGGAKRHPSLVVVLVVVVRRRTHRGDGRPRLSHPAPPGAIDNSPGSSEAAAATVPDCLLPLPTAYSQFQPRQGRLSIAQGGAARRNPGITEPPPHALKGRSQGPHGKPPSRASGPAAPAGGPIGNRKSEISRPPSPFTFTFTFTALSSSPCFPCLRGKPALFP